MSEERTEKPTPRKRREHRREGQVPRTQELGGWAGVLAVALALPPLLEREVAALRELMVACLTSVADPDGTEPAVALRLLGDGLGHVALALVLLGAGVMLVGVAGTLAQGGFYLATKLVTPSWKTLNLVTGARRVFGLQALWEGTKMLLKAGVVALLVWFAIRSMTPYLGGLVPVDTMLRAIGDEALALLRAVAVAGIAMGAADYAYQRHRVGKQTRMTKEEVRQEHKQTEGDPLVKSALRGRQLAAARNRMLADVPTADVVLVNPTHVAVALRYDAERGAPRVVARGAGAVAARIREEAVRSRVPLVRDVPLARALHTSTRVGQEIPPELFAAVAQVLAFVISRRTAGHGGGEHRSPRHESELPPVPVAGRRRRTSSGPAPAGR